MSAHLIVMRLPTGDMYCFRFVYWRLVALLLSDVNNDAHDCLCNITDVCVPEMCRIKGK